MSIPEYDSNLHIKFKDLRAAGWPFPAEIPDEAYTRSRSLKVSSQPREGNKQSVIVTFGEPIYCGTKVYRVVGKKVVSEDVKPEEKRPARS